MADSLVELKSQMDSRSPVTYESDGETKQPGQPLTVPVALNVPHVPAEKLMADADERADFSNEQKDTAGLIKQSLDLLIQKGKEDPAAGKKYAAELHQTQGEDYALKAVDLADKVKIDFLKKQYPERFNGPQAAMSAFLNEASFGQLSRIIGGVGTLVAGVPYEQVVKQKAEEFRLLEKEYPKSDMIGKAAAFLIPGSPVKALFESTAALGAKGAGAIIKRIVANPELMSKIVQSGVAGAAGAGAVGLVQGTAGKNLQDFGNLDRGADEAESSAIGGGLMGAFLPAAGAAIKGAVKIAAPMVRGVAEGANRVVGKVVSELSSTPTAALRAFNRDPEILRQAAGTEKDIGHDLVDFLLNPKKSKVAEVESATKLLPQLPDVDPKGVIDYLKGFKSTSNPEYDAPIARLKEWATRFEKSIGGEDTGKIPAAKMRQFVDELQDAASDQYGRESGLYKSAVKTAARMARLQIVNAAQKEGGEVGQNYAALMKKAADKVTVLKFIKRQLGSTPEMMAQRAEGFTDRVFGKNKDFLRARMADLDTKFGTNFMERARLAQQAESLGKGGNPSYFSNAQTGRSTLGSKIGAAAGGAVGVVGGLMKGGDITSAGSGGIVGSMVGKFVGGVASSPRLGAFLMGTSDSVSGFMRRIVADPEVIERLAGKLAQNPGKNQATLQRLTIPFEIRRLADEISNTLTKDGPRSAGSTVRLIADTPYFMGLVHYFDLMERRQNKQNVREAIPLLKQ